MPREPLGQSLRQTTSTLGAVYSIFGGSVTGLKISYVAVASSRP